MCQSGKTAFHLAAGHGHLEVVEFLIGMGCAHDIKDKVRDSKSHGDTDTTQCVLIRFSLLLNAKCTSRGQREPKASEQCSSKNLPM